MAADLIDFPPPPPPNYHPGAQHGSGWDREQGGEFDPAEWWEGQGEWGLEDGDAE